MRHVFMATFREIREVKKFEKQMLISPFLIVSPMSRCKNVFGVIVYSGKSV